jgi:PAS domain S-box-containing protein
MIRRLFNTWLKLPHASALLSALLTLLALGTLAVIISRWYEQRLITDRRAQTMSELSRDAHTYTALLERSLARLEGLAVFAESEQRQPDDVVVEFEPYAQALIDNTSTVLKVVLRLNGQPSRLYPASDTGGSNIDMAQLQSAFETAAGLPENEITITPPFEVRPGQLALGAVGGIHHPELGGGQVAIVFDLSAILVESRLEDQPLADRMALRDENGTVFYGDPAVYNEQPVLTTIRLPGRQWTLATAPKAGWAALIQDDLRLFQFSELLIVLPLTGLVLLTVNRQARMAQAVEARTRDLAQLAAELQQDIAERRRAEAALRASEEKFSAAFEHAPVMIAISTLEDGTYLDVNQKFLEVSGFTREEVIGHTSIELGWLAAADRRRLLDVLATQGHLSGVELDLTTKDRRVVRCLLNGEYIVVDGRRRLLSIALDISERKRAEETLRLDSLRQQALVRLNEMSAASECEMIEAALEDAVRLTDSQIGYWHLVHADQENLELFVWSKAATAQCFAVENRHYPLSQAGIWVDCVRRRQPVVHNDYATAPGRRGLPAGHTPVTRHMAVPLFDDEGRVLAIAGVGNKPTPYDDADVHRLADFVTGLWTVLQRRRVQEELRQLNADLEQRVAERTRELAEANAQLQELDQLKSQFVSDVSHELRTPITGLKLYLDLLEHGKPEKRAHYLARINEQANRMAQLIEDILDLSRLERDRTSLVFSPIDLNAVLERVVIDLQPRAHAAGLQLIFAPGADLPPVPGDLNRLLQVGTNLIANAINYTPAGEVRVCSYACDHSVVFEVQDTGVGIAPDELPHLFERFYRGRRASQSGVRGTGLGLSIVKDIIDLHGGRVEVSSQVNAGSTFRVTLPAME